MESPADAVSDVSLRGAGLDDMYRSLHTAERSVLSSHDRLSIKLQPLPPSYTAANVGGLVLQHRQLPSTVGAFEKRVL